MNITKKELEYITDGLLTLEREYRVEDKTIIADNIWQLYLKTLRVKTINIK